MGFLNALLFDQPFAAFGVWWWVDTVVFMTKVFKKFDTGHWIGHWIMVLGLERQATSILVSGISYLGYHKPSAILPGDLDLSVGNAFERFVERLFGDLHALFFRVLSQPV